MVCLIKCFNKHNNWTERTYDDYVYVLNRFSVKRAMLLEFSQYLENYLWPNFNAAKVCKHAKKEGNFENCWCCLFFLCSDSESWEGVEFESHVYSDTLFCLTV